MARAGDDLPRCHRVSRFKNGQGARHQIASQRRWSTRGHGAQLVEPLRELFKDEVRQIGLELGLPGLWSSVIRSRPGLGVRILGEVKHEYRTTS